MRDNNKIHGRRINGKLRDEELLQQHGILRPERYGARGVSFMLYTPTATGDWLPRSFTACDYDGVIRWFTYWPQQKHEQLWIENIADIDFLSRDVIEAIARVAEIPFFRGGRKK